MSAHLTFNKRDNVRINVIPRRVRELGCLERAISSTYSEYIFVALVIQHAKHMRRIILFSVASPAVTCFTTSTHRRHDFREKKILNTKCVFWFSLKLLPEIFLILRTSKRHTIKNVRWSSCKNLLFLSDLIFLTDFQKTLKYQNSWKSIEWELSCSMWRDGQTWQT